MANVREYATIDSHAGGEPIRLIVEGAPKLFAPTMAARRFELREHHDHVRRSLLFEPRGHADMYGAILSDPVTPGADYGVNFLTNEGYSTMCGHGIIALTTTLIETGRHPANGETARIIWDTPAGVVTATAEIEQNRVIRVAFENVPAARLNAGFEVEIDGKSVPVDLVWGGAFYALVQAELLGEAIDPKRVDRLIRAGMAVKRATMSAIDVVHPFDPLLNGLYGTILTGPPSSDAADGRNIVIFADGEVDRSPCGTGTSARLAALYADGQIGLGAVYRHESVTGSVFTGRVLRETTFGRHPAVVTEIGGRAFITGHHRFVIDNEDPFATGFLLRGEEEGA
jgi:proline racemase